jgi:lysine-specific demethylase 3
MSRFCTEELANAIQEMEALLEREESTPSTGDVASIEELPSVNPNSDPATLPDYPQKAYYPPILSETTMVTPHRELRRVPDEVLTPALFERIWSLGEPFVVADVLHKFNLRWTPEYFIEKYGKESCLIIECQTDTNKRVTVEQFFSKFGNHEGRKESWKLKDWPSSAEFKTTFPELYEDFSNAVPVPDYVRRDGVMNMSSHFPANVIGPDLGPKMYNAMASSLGEGSKGTTRLHMDMADALNVMTFASPCEDGSPGCAAWDLFRAEDSDDLRTFLRKRFQGIAAQDPIHSQQVYLDEALKKELYDMLGVKSYRVYQRPGDAIFIPAGCAHQVANLADCVKVAIDFVSPENVARCEQLTQEFREQNQGLKWKEDVLQLKTMMWFAWLSCRHQEEEERRKGESAGSMSRGSSSNV